jgi:hypothetical protein
MPTDEESGDMLVDEFPDKTRRQWISIWIWN